MAKTLTREQNKAKAARYRANRKARELAAKLAQTDTTTVGMGSVAQPGVGLGSGPDVTTPGAAGDSEDTLNVTVKASTEPPRKQTLREKLGLGGGAKKIVQPQAVKRTGGAKRKSDKPNLVVTMLPTLLASLVAAWARDRIPDEYRPCAPSKEEVLGMIGPLMDIMGRRIEIAAQVSQDALDITNSIICGMAYGVRAYVTYVDIKKTKEAGLTYEEKQQRRAVSSDGQPTLAGGLGAYQNAVNGVVGDPVGSNGTRPAIAVNGAPGNGADNPDDDQQLRNSEAALIADMFRRDIQGRQQLGLLPRSL